VSALHERNRALRALLVRVHAHVERLDGDAARALEERIWTELVESTRRRQLDLAMPS
jgi:predicted DNA-binding ribbon-helix-helix protein